MVQVITRSKYKTKRRNQYSWKHYKMNDIKLLFIFILTPSSRLTNNSTIFLDQIIIVIWLNFLRIHKRTINHNLQEVHLSQVKIKIDTHKDLALALSKSASPASRTLIWALCKELCNWTFESWSDFIFSDYLLTVDFNSWFIASNFSLLVFSPIITSPGRTV